MPKKKLDFEAVRKVALAMPDVVESTIYGKPSLKLRGKLLACPALHKSCEPDTLAIRIDFDQRDELITGNPSIYYVTEHYENYPMVLVRLPAFDRKALRDLLKIVGF